MTSVVTPSFGAFLSELGLGEAGQASTSRFADVREAPRQKSSQPSKPLPPEHREEKYPRWAVTLFVVGFCAAFWGGLVWLALSLLG